MRARVVGGMPCAIGTSMTRARPQQQVERQRFGPGPSSKKCRGASTCVPQCALMCSVETFELSPRASRLIGSRLNGVLPG